MTEIKNASLSEDQRERILGLIRDIPDWPEPGVVFKDITPLLADHSAFADVIATLAAAGRDEAGVRRVDKVVGIEARGFILAAPVALVLGAGFVPVRKHGKLPYDTYETSYQLEYGNDVLEVHSDAFEPGDRVLIIDDVLATGGTARATTELVQRSGGQVVALSVLLELSFLHGRDRLGDVDFHALITT